MNFKLIDLQYDIAELKKELLREENDEKRELIAFSISLLYRVIESNFNIDVGLRGFYSKFYKHEYEAIDKIMFDFRDNKQMFCDTFSNAVKIKYYSVDNLNLYREFTNNEMHEIFSMFFNDLGADFYNMYKQIFNNNFISDSVYSSSQVEGRCTYIPSLNHSYISINSSRHFMMFLYTVVHEMGHFYESTKQKCSNITDFYACVNSPYCEVSSLLFTNLFLTFLLEKHIFSREALTSFTIDNDNLLDFLYSTNFCFRYMMGSNSYSLSNNMNFIDLEYFNDLARKITLETGIHYIYNKDKMDFLNSVKYSFSNIVADNLWELFMNDRDEAFRRMLLVSDDYNLPVLTMLKKAHIKKNDIITGKSTQVKSLYLKKKFLSE